MRKFFQRSLAAALICGIACPVFAFYDSGKGGEVKTEVKTTAEDTNPKAVVYKLEGTAVITKSGTPEEKELKKGDEIGAGDSVFTNEGASLSIRFDAESLNTVTIPSGSKAIFKSINPASVYLKNGSVFSSVDGLAEGSTWEVTTPAAVAAVRGTQFEVEYSESSGEFSAATYDDDNDKKSSAVELKPVAGGEAIRIVEGKQLSFARGQIPTQKFIQKMSPDRIQRAKKFKQEVKQERKQIMEKKLKEEKNIGGPRGPGGGEGSHGAGAAKNENRFADKPNGFQPLDGSNDPLNPVRNKNELMPPLPSNQIKDGRLPKPMEKMERPNLPPINENKVIQPSRPKVENQNQPQNPPMQPAQKRNAPPPPARKK